MYASFLSFCAPCIRTFLNSLFRIEFFDKLLMGYPDYSLPPPRQNAIGVFLVMHFEIHDMSLLSSYRTSLLPRRGGWRPVRLPKKKAEPAGPCLFNLVILNECYFLNFLLATATPARPRPRSSMVAGSGTAAVCVGENIKLSIV